MVNLRTITGETLKQAALKEPEHEAQDEMVQISQKTGHQSHTNIWCVVDTKQSNTRCSVMQPPCILC